MTIFRTEKRLVPTIVTDEISDSRQISLDGNIMLRFRNRHFLVFDFLALLVTPTLALSLVIDVTLASYGPTLAMLTVAFLGARLAVFYLFGLYKRYWIYASIDEMARIAGAVACSLLANYGLLYALIGLGFAEGLLPAGWLLIESLFVFVIVGASRFSIRFSRRFRERRLPVGDRVPTLIVGAGEAGAHIVAELQSNTALGLWPAVFVDDDREKLGLRIRDVPVEGPTDAIRAIARAYNAANAVIAMPSATGRSIRRINDACRDAGLETRIIPGMSELLDGSVRVSQLRPVRIQDLLRREPVRVDESEIAETIRGARLLVTGGGGSIGAELCRQILKYGPASLVVVDHSENAVFSMLHELGDLKQRLGSSSDVLGRIGDIRSVNRLEEIFDVCLPDIVFHAAAHKHVPLLEGNVCEAVTNNVQGTLNVLDACVRFDVPRFVMLSTDKAVNPTSIMGATKRVAELLVKNTAATSGLPYVSVRFGNVLGSTGSVVPIFSEQIRRGGPITVTHPEMERYFMSIPEAAQLVLQASALAHGGEIYVLDMGEPIRIVDLAGDLVRLSGLVAGKDIEIVFTGIRPGEKLREELFFGAEHVHPTQHDKILVTTESPEERSAELSDEVVTELIGAALDVNTDETRRRLGLIFRDFLQAADMLSDRAHSLVQAEDAAGDPMR